MLNGDLQTLPATLVLGDYPPPEEREARVPQYVFGMPSVGEDHRGLFPSSIHLMGATLKRSLPLPFRVLLTVTLMVVPSTGMTQVEEMLCSLKGHRYTDPTGRVVDIPLERGPSKMALRVHSDQTISVSLPDSEFSRFICDATTPVWSCSRPGVDARFVPTRGVLTLMYRYPREDGRRVGYAFECERR